MQEWGKVLYSDWRDWESYVDFQQEKINVPDSHFLYYITGVLLAGLVLCRLGITAGALVVRTCCWELGAKVLRVEGKRASWEKEAGGSIYGHAGVCGQHPTRPSAVPVQGRRNWLGVVIKHAAPRSMCWESLWA